MRITGCTAAAAGAAAPHAATHPATQLPACLESRACPDPVSATSPPTITTAAPIFQRLGRPLCKFPERRMLLLQLASRLPYCRSAEFLPSAGQSSTGAAARAARPPRAIAGQDTTTTRCALVRASSPAAPLPPTSTPTPKPRSPTSSSVFSSRQGPHATI